VLHRQFTDLGATNYVIIRPRLLLRTPGQEVEWTIPSLCFEKQTLSDLVISSGGNSTREQWQTGSLRRSVGRQNYVQGELLERSDGFVGLPFCLRYPLGETPCAALKRREK
jgi:hypothetical protein